MLCGVPFRAMEMFPLRGHRRTNNGWNRASITKPLAALDGINRAGRRNSLLCRRPRESLRAAKLDTRRRCRAVFVVWARRGYASHVTFLGCFDARSRNIPRECAHSVSRGAEPFWRVF
jgi:hypothetical protein